MVRIHAFSILIHIHSFISDEVSFECMVLISVVSRQVFGRTGQMETWFETPRRVETGFETTQNLIHSSK